MLMMSLRVEIVIKMLIDKSKADKTKTGQEGGFQFKEWIKSGDENKSVNVLGTGRFNKVLGCSWSTEYDEGQLFCKI